MNQPKEVVATPTGTDLSVTGVVPDERKLRKNKCQSRGREQAPPAITEEYCRGEGDQKRSRVERYSGNRVTKALVEESLATGPSGEFCELHLPGRVTPDGCLQLVAH